MTADQDPQTAQEGTVRIIRSGRVHDPAFDRTIFSFLSYNGAAICIPA